MQYKNKEDPFSLYFAAIFLSPLFSDICLTALTSLPFRFLYTSKSGSVSLFLKK